MKERSRILVIGGAGYIGAHVNKALAARGYATVVMDDLSTGHRELLRWGDIALGDYGDRAFLDSVFQAYSIAGVMHLAACTDVAGSFAEPRKYYLNNVRKTAALLDAMVENGVTCLIYSSSCAVYGNPDSLPLREEHALAPVNPYGMTKLLVENALERCGRDHGMRHVALRYFNAAGADPDGEIGEWHDPETHLVPIALEAALGKRSVVRLYGTDYETHDGTCVRDYVHVQDIAEAHVRAWEYLRDNGRSDVFNLGSEQGHSVGEVLHAASRVTGRTIVQEAAGRRCGDAPVLISSAAKARRTLCWSPRYSGLDSMIETAWRWQQRRA